MPFVHRSVLQLKVEGQRALLEQALRTIRANDKCTSRYLKFLVTSTHLLMCSRFNYFRMYRLVFSNWYENTIEVCVVPYNHDRQQYKGFPGEKFRIENGQALSLLCLLKSQLVDVRYSKNFYLNDKNEQKFFKTVVEQSNGKVALNLIQGLGSVCHLMESNSSKIKELAFNASHLPNKLTLKTLRLDYYSIKQIKSMNHLKKLVKGHVIKKLRLAFDINDESTETKFSINFPDSMLNESVQQLELCLSGNHSLPILKRFVQRVRTFFPHLRRLTVESWTDLLEEQTIAMPETAAYILLENYAKIQQVSNACTQLGIPVQSQFDFNFYVDNLQDPEWLEEMQNEESLEQAKLKFKKIEKTPKVDEDPVSNMEVGDESDSTDDPLYELVTSIKSEQANCSFICNLKMTSLEFMD